MPSNKIRRNTPQRMVILQELCATKEHPTAAELFAAVRRKLPRVSLGTIYRNLEVLHEDGFVRKLELAGHETRFDGTTAPHYHVRCTSCGCVRDLPAPLHDKLVTQPVDSAGFRIDGHRLEFYGLCPGCQQGDMGRMPVPDMPEHGSH